MTWRHTTKCANNAEAMGERLSDGSMPCDDGLVEASNEQINRAGGVLRAFWRGERMADAEVEAARELVAGFRREHAYPLTLVTVGLRQFVEAVQPDAPVGQRLKRMDRILEKLVRFPEMKLARMQDVGGCRAVLRDPDAVAAVAARIRRNWDVKRERDHRVTPEETTGYRALHLIVSRTAPGQKRSRLVEIQLRTSGEHLWAEEVERVAARTRFALKDGRGPAELLEYFCVAGEVIHLSERKEPPIAELGERYGRYKALRAAVRDYLRPSG